MCESIAMSTRSNTEVRPAFIKRYVVVRNLKGVLKQYIY